ncbi:MAG: RNA methyltransferase [Verrucomicrobiota bacterium]
MFELRKIETFDLPELQPYATMRRSIDHERQGIFVAEGTKVVRRLLESRFELVSVLLPEKWVDSFRPLLETRPETFPVFVAEKKLLEKLTGFSMFQGVLAVGRIPARPTLESLLDAAPRPRLLAAVEGLTSAENLGALVRNCAAFGVHGLVVGESSSSPFLRRAVRNSMGTIFQLPVFELPRTAPIPPAGNSWTEGPDQDVVLAPPPHAASPGLAAALRQLRAQGVRCVAAHPRADGRTLAGTDFSGDCCVVFGSEGFGISEDVLAACDDAVAVPMAPGVDSLNVAAAAAVFLYEIRRQRGQG